MLGPRRTGQPPRSSRICLIGARPRRSMFSKSMQDLYTSFAILNGFASPGSDSSSKIIRTCKKGKKEKNQIWYHSLKDLCLSISKWNPSFAWSWTKKEHVSRLDIFRYGLPVSAICRWGQRRMTSSCDLLELPCVPWILRRRICRNRHMDQRIGPCFARFPRPSARSRASCSTCPRNKRFSRSASGRGRHFRFRCQCHSQIWRLPSSERCCRLHYNRSDDFWKKEQNMVESICIRILVSLVFLSLLQ